MPAKQNPSPSLTFDALQPPVRVVVRCQDCGYRRATLALHHDALRRAASCERCSGANDLLGADAVHSPFGCSCCT